MENCDGTVKVSVIIPVYNAEPFIARCIESLKKQSLKELEFIFVDDCSTDQGMELVNQWAVADSRVKVLQNEYNMGEGASRNRGIEIARGIYVNTIDPDDWVAPNFYELLYAKALETSVDIVKGTRIKIRIDENSCTEVLPRSELNRLIIKSLSNGHPLFKSLYYEHQTIIIKREILDGGIKYGSSSNACDTVFLLRLCAGKRSFALENDAYYYYLQREGAATSGFSLKRSRNELLSLKEQLEFFLLQNIWSEETTYAYLSRAYRTYASRFCHANTNTNSGETISNEDKTKYISELRECVMSIPEYKVLYSSVPELQVLIEEELLLPSSLCEEYSVFCKELSEWTAYILKTDGLKKRIMRNRLMNLLETHKRKCIGSGNKDIYFREYIPWIKKCIKRLELSDQAYIVARSIKRLIKGKVSIPKSV